MDISSEPVKPTSPAKGGVHLERVSTHASSAEKKPISETEVLEAQDDAEAQQAKEQRRSFYARYRPFILAGVAVVILGWWISSIVLPATRSRWIVQTFWAWFFLLVIAFRFIPNSVVTVPVAAVWNPLVATPWFKLPYRVRLTVGWLCLLAIIFGSAFGFALPEGTTLGDRAISILGLFVFQFTFYATSSNRSQIPWPTVIVGLFIQQVIALFVLKTGAGFSIFNWIATLASDFLQQGTNAAAFFFDTATIDKHWFFVNVLAAIIFFIAFVQACYYLGIMQWIIGKFAWLFFKLLNVSGAEAVVAAASPWIGQGESACLVRPYVDLMTESEIHLTMTSGFSTISGSVLGAYIALGASPEHLVTASVMSIPASISISKIRVPETEEPVTRGRVVVDRGSHERGGPPANVLHAFSRGAIFGVVVAGQILANVLTILALIYAADGLLTWVGKGFGIQALTLELILGYIFYPVTFLMGVPRAEILRVSQLLGIKLVANEFVGFTNLQAIMSGPNPLSPRAHTIATYALAGFANLGSLGIQVGVLSALAPSRAKIIARVAFSAMLCGFLSTMQTASIAGMLV